MSYNTGNPTGANGSYDPRDLYDNSEDIDVWATSLDKVQHPDRHGVQRKTWHGIEAGAEESIQDFLAEQGYQELGEYEAGIEITQLNQVITVGNYMYRVSPDVGVPYITSGDWDADSPYFVQIDFVTAAQLADERRARQDADANLQSQMTGTTPLEASAFSPISWHDQIIRNSITIPPNKNAWSFGPRVTIAPGQIVTVEDGSFWTIANGEGSSGGSGFNGDFDYGELEQ